MSRPKILMTGHWEPLAIYKKPFVGMTWNYYEAITHAGGMPILLPYCGDMDEYIEMSDGLVLTGGYDIDPAFYNEEVKYNTVEITRVRDDLEKTLLDKWLKTGKPIFGICRGIQLINVLLGGTLYQDLDSEHPSSVEHHMLPPYNRTVHRVTLEPGILSSLIREWEFGVNSYHHQAICRLAPVLHTEAVSQDGLIEGVSCPDMRFLLAVQWHPELIYREDPRNFAIVKAFADAVRGI